MAKCEFCNKGVVFGIQVSHSHRRSNRPWKPNVKRVKAIVNGTPKHVYVHPPPFGQSYPRCVIENVRFLKAQARNGLCFCMVGVPGAGAGQALSCQGSPGYGIIPHIITKALPGRPGLAPWKRRNHGISVVHQTDQSGRAV